MRLLIAPSRHGSPGETTQAITRRTATDTAQLTASLIVLATGLAANALLGPLAFELIDYRFGSSMINQAIGLDFVALVVAAPLALYAAWLIRRDHPAGRVLAMAPALFAAYMMPQYVIGPDYLELPGNNESFALGHIALFILSIGVAAAAWGSIDASLLRPKSATSDRRRVMVLVAIAVFIGLGGSYRRSAASSMTPPRTPHTSTTPPHSGSSHSSTSAWSHPLPWWPLGGCGTVRAGQERRLSPSSAGAASSPSPSQQ